MRTDPHQASQVLHQGTPSSPLYYFAFLNSKYPLSLPGGAYVHINSKRTSLFAFSALRSVFIPSFTRLRTSYCLALPQSTKHLFRSMRFIVTTYIALLGLFTATAVHAAPFKVASDNNLVNVRRSGEIITLLESRVEQSPEAQTQTQQSPADPSKLEVLKTGKASKKVHWDPSLAKEPTGSEDKNGQTVIVTFTGEAAGLDPEGKPLTPSNANAAKAVHDPQTLDVPPRIGIRLNEWTKKIFERKMHVVYNNKYMLEDPEAGFSFRGQYKNFEFLAKLPPVPPLARHNRST
ncbi:hypothetical protein F5051DRAFT_423611 [Lentinula edodes]|nr:hypothetical protein F5051DRAFT_423611 [Lentinula edodes]